MNNSTCADPSLRENGCSSCRTYIDDRRPIQEQEYFFIINDRRFGPFCTDCVRRGITIKVRYEI